MGAPHLVKVGLMGVVGQYQSPDFTVFARDAQVICRTLRGLEFGEVICPLDQESHGDSNPDGQILRQVGTEDQLILERLERHRDKAFEACQNLIQERRLPGVLVDVEHLFDGESVFFYFLGEVDPQTEALTNELAETYERKVRFKKFAQTLAEGCGPECGTKDCSSSGCGSCALSGGCGSKKAQSSEQAAG